jgi:small subunit ribosomal protein S17
MAKILTGKVISTAMNGVIVVEVTRKTPHPLYKKLMKKSKKFKVAVNGKTAVVGDTVSIRETRPISKDTHFALYEKESKATAAKVPAEKKEAAVAKPTVKKTKKEGKN